MKGPGYSGRAAAARSQRLWRPGAQATSYKLDRFQAIGYYRIMLKKEARKIRTNKEERRKKKPGSVCAGCYALKGRYRFNNVQAALNRRLQALEDPRWVDAMVTLITGEKYFRWHDSGDIQSMKHLENIFEVCKRTSGTRHWMPTREAQFLKQLDPATIPPNLIIRMSSHMIDQGPVKFWPWTSTVTSQAGRTCPAPEQGNSCGSCRQCWDRSTPNVCYGKH